MLIFITAYDVWRRRKAPESKPELTYVVGYPPSVVLLSIVDLVIRKTLQIWIGTAPLPTAVVTAVITIVLIRVTFWASARRDKEQEADMPMDDD